MHLNTKYMELFRNTRDNSQYGHLARQLEPKHFNTLVDACVDTTLVINVLQTLVINVLVFVINIQKKCIKIIVCSFFAVKQFDVYINF